MISKDCVSPIEKINPKINLISKISFLTLFLVLYYDQQIFKTYILHFPTSNS